MKLKLFCLSLLSLSISYSSFSQNSRGGGDPGSGLNITKIDTANGYSFDGGPQWNKNWKRSYTYGAKNLLDKTTEDWINSTTEDIQVEYQYDAYRNVTERIESKGNAATNVWTADEKKEYEYDNDQRLTQETSFTWDGSNWVNDSKVELIYNGIQHESTTHFTWDAGNSQWEKETTFYSEYSFGLRMKGYLAEWNGTVEDTTEIYFYGFDQDGRPDSTLTQRWNTDSNAFENAELVVRLFSSEHAKTSETTSNWDILNLQWNKNTRHKYSLNANNEVLVDSLHFYDLETWIKDSVIVYKRSEYTIISNVSEQTEMDEWKIYPVPATTHLNISGTPDQVDVYDLNGRKIQVQMEYSNKTLYLGTLPSGMYLLHLQKGNTVSVKTFFKE